MCLPGEGAGIRRSLLSGVSRRGGALRTERVVTENAEAWRQKVGQVVKIMMAELPFLPAVDEQTGPVPPVGRGLGDELGRKFEVQFGGKHTIQCKSASTSRGQSPNSHIFQ